MWRNSLPAQSVRLEIVADGVPLRSAPLDGRGPDNIVCAGQRVTLPVGRWDWLYLVGCSERRIRDFVTWHFVDGSADRG